MAARDRARLLFSHFRSTTNRLALQLDSFPIFFQYRDRHFFTPLGDIYVTQDTTTSYTTLTMPPQDHSARQRGAAAEVRVEAMLAMGSDARVALVGRAFTLPLSVDQRLAVVQASGIVDPCRRQGRDGSTGDE